VAFFNKEEGRNERMNLSRIILVNLLVAILIMASGISSALESGPETEEKAKVGEDNAVELEEVVVTASRYERAVGDIPASVTLITREQIEGSSGMQLDDILRKYAGIDITASSFLSHSADVVLRGMGEMPGRTLILYDGAPINKADTGSANWDLFRAEDVERIEIVRGPASALYGSNAMGGVINIISRKPDSAKPMAFEARGMYGSFNTLDTGGTLSGQVDGFQYHISFDHLDSDGYNPVPEEERTEYDIERYLQEDHLKTRFAYELPNGASVSLGYLFFDDKRGEGEKIRHDDGVYRKWKTNSLNLDYDWRTGAADWTLKIGYNKEDYFWNREQMKKGLYTLYEVDVDRVDSSGSVQATFPVRDSHLLTTGIDFRYGSVDGNDIDIIRNDNPSDTVVHNEGKQLSYSFFLNDQIKTGERMVVDAGVRYDYVKGYDGRFSDSSGFLSNEVHPDKNWSHLSPKVAVLYRITDKTVLRASIGTAFRAPILDDLYRSGILRGKIYAANPDLGPEKLISYEAGINHTFSEEVSFGVSGYFSQGKDFFYPVEVGIDPYTGRDLYMRKNIGKVHIYGGEFEADWKMNDMFTFFGNYTFNVSKIEEFDEQPELESKYLEDSPRHKANLGMTFSHPDMFRAGITGRYVGDRYGDTENTAEGELEDYLVLDLKILKEFTQYCEVYVDVLNLFDKEIMYSSDFEGPGVEIRGGLTLRF
jgi:iron complex outermembrane receptor protein